MLTMVLLGLGGEQDFLVNDLGLGGDYAATHTADHAEVLITIRTDRTWTVSAGAGDVLSGTPTSGTWLHSGGTASNYELRYTASNEVGAPTVTNDAASFTAITANLIFRVSKTNADASAVCLVEIRPKAGGRAVTDSSALSANGSL